MFFKNSKSAAITTVAVLLFALLLSAASGPATTSSATLYGFVVKSIASMRTLAAVFRLATGSDVTTATEPAYEPEPSLTEEDILQCSGEPAPAPKSASQS